MSDYHILEQSRDQKTLRVAFHVSVPDLTNETGKNYREAIVEHFGQGALASRVPGHAINFAGEDAQLKAGEVFEEVIQVRFSSLGLGSVQKRSEIEATYNKVKTEALERLQAELEWWGQDGNIS